ncbi:uncharacterized protein B0H18DRAFT_1014239 [Fomitopsis serialis]|uniref:uncharacterized protein n=1 Tax=Fomitopsis serialis TaxID=139415 RepID=UPI0020077C61|nr:uncharacterized protein B0H18DRAFT_1014239 [Neoantrodia serialis]KAH9923613.1 hypothetical protein B0H18DRAFT_1014239 [Neoantrodia serialis]
MDEDSMDFLHNANETLSTPLAPRHTQSRTRAPLTLQDLTPRSTRTRPTPVRSSLRPRPRPAIATPFRAALAKNISDALCEDISSAPRQDLSFQIPTAAAQGTIPSWTHTITSAFLIAPTLRSAPTNNNSTPEHAAAELPQTRAGSVSTSTDEVQGAEALTMQGACRVYFALEAH